MNPKIQQGLLAREKARLAASGASVDALKAVDARIAAAKSGGPTPAVVRDVASAAILSPEFEAKYGKHPAVAALTERLAAAAAEAPASTLKPIEKIKAGIAARDRAKETAP
jgi:hypothetical protein